MAGDVATSGSPAEDRPVRRADYGRGVDATAEAVRLAGNRQPDVAILSSGQSFTVQEALARILASGIRQELILSRIAAAQEATAEALTALATAPVATQTGKPRGA